MLGREHRKVLGQGAYQAPVLTCRSPRRPSLLLKIFLSLLILSISSLLKTATHHRPVYSDHHLKLLSNQEKFDNILHSIDQADLDREILAVRSHHEQLLEHQNKKERGSKGKGGSPDYSNYQINRFEYDGDSDDEDGDDALEYVPDPDDDSSISNLADIEVLEISDQLIREAKIEHQEEKAAQVSLLSELKDKFRNKSIQSETIVENEDEEAESQAILEGILQDDVQTERNGINKPLTPDVTISKQQAKSPQSPEAFTEKEESDGDDAQIPEDSLSTSTTTTTGG